MGVNLSLKERLFWAGLVLVYFVAWYHLSWRLSLQSGGFHILSLAVEEKIPFLPFSFLIYASLFITPFYLVLILKKPQEFTAAFLCFILAIWISKMIWLFYPVQYHLRPTLPLATSGLIFWIQFFYQMDGAALNCFPSLHVTFAFLFFYLAYTFHRKLTWHLLIYATLVSLSTLTFKQHYVLDILGGVGLATGLWLLILYRRPA